MTLVSRAYLAFYNTVQFCGWAAILWRTASVYLQSKSTSAVYQEVSHSVEKYQGLAILETVHALLGLVRGAPAVAFLQWFGRSNALFALLKQITAVQSGWAIPALFASWAAAEVVRYPWYAIAQVTEPPRFLTWLRFTMFIFLYPIGIGAEIAIILKSLPQLREQKMYSIEMPNVWNFAFSYAVFAKVGVFALYPVFAVVIYRMLLAQRQKKLGSSKSKLH